MRLRFTATVAAGLSLAIVLTLSACSPDEPVVVRGTPSSSESVVPSAPTPSPTVEAAEGTREKPIPAGGTAKHSDDSVWVYSVGASDPDGGPEVMNENPYNTIAEGNTLVLAPVHISVEADASVPDGADPWASFTVSYVTASGNSYGPCDVALPNPGDLSALGAMYAGAQADFLACASVPSADVIGGLWRVTSKLDSSASVFFAGA